MRDPAPKTRRVLMVCYYFPPLGGIGSLRALKFAEYLPQFGWDVVVLAPRNGAYYRDASLHFPEEQVCRSFSLEVSRLGKRVVDPGVGDTRPARVGAATRALRDLVRRFAYRPDGQVGWYPFAVRAGRRLLREARFDAIFSSSFPVTAHLIAQKLHRESGLPWIAEFRDPFADALPEGDARKRWAERTEREILHEADAAVVTSPAWYDLLLSKGARSAALITNGCDPGDFPSPISPEHFVLSHLGSFMPERQDASNVLEALSELRASGALPDARLRLIGDPPGEVLQCVRSYGLDPEVTGFLPYKEALARMSASTALLVAGAQDTNPLYRGWIPAKTFDYLATGLPVIYVGDPGTDAARFLGGHAGCHIVQPGDVSSARGALLVAADSPRTARNLTGFTRRDLAQTLSRLLDASCAKRAGKAG